MLFRERQRPPVEAGPRAGGSGNDNDPQGQNLENVRNEGERLLNAGDDAIDRALSGNSAEFLRASHQEGGE